MYFGVVFDVSLFCVFLFSKIFEIFDFWILILFSFSFKTFLLLMIITLEDVFSRGSSPRWLAGRAVRLLHDTDDTGSDPLVVVSLSSFFENFKVFIVAWFLIFLFWIFVFIFFCVKFFRCVIFFIVCLIIKIKVSRDIFFEYGITNNMSFVIISSENNISWRVFIIS